MSPLNCGSPDSSYLKRQKGALHSRCFASPATAGRTGRIVNTAQQVNSLTLWSRRDLAGPPREAGDPMDIALMVFEW